MILYYVRHGDPIYDPDSLTPLGKRQAEAVAKRLAVHGIDKIYSSPSNRAVETAIPTCEILKKEITTVDFANEALVWDEITFVKNGHREWLYRHGDTRDLFFTREILNAGFEWYNCPQFKEFDYKKGMDRVRRDVDAFLLDLGYEHIPYTGKYKVVKPNSEKVALFAHEGFGTAFLSTVLDIPYPLFSSRFAMSHSAVTIINFSERDGFAYPEILTYSNDAHIYKEGLPTSHNNSKTRF